MAGWRPREGFFNSTQGIFLVLFNPGNRSGGERTRWGNSGEREWEEWKREMGKERRGKEKEMNKQTNNKKK